MAKILILYTTKYGYTERTANRLKAELGQDVRLVNLMKEQAPALDGCDTVILGGSVYYGKVQKQLTAYISRNLEELKHKKLGLFISAGLPDEEKKRQELLAAFPAPLREQAVCADILGDEIAFAKLSWLDKLITRTVMGSKTGHSHPEDAKVHRFAQALLA